jgi:hypothetical protein
MVLTQEDRMYQPEILTAEKQVKRPPIMFLKRDRLVILSKLSIGFHLVVFSLGFQSRLISSKTARTVRARIDTLPWGA